MTAERLICATFAAVAVLAGSPAAAQIPKLQIESGEFKARLSIAAAVQAAVVDVQASTELEREFEFFARLDAEWRLPSNVELGVKIEFANRDRDTEALETGEIYGFMATKFGRVEVGKQDGPADTLSYAAPTIALGQIRGDFSRYAGSQALLKPLDTKDSFKLIYVSPEVRGVRAGMSWSPKFQQNSKATDPRSRTLVRDAIELGVQIDRSLGGWKLGISGGYAFGKADPATTRAKLDSWSIGAKARRGALRIGGAYVQRGDSNRLEEGFNQWEVNGGVAWVEEGWGVSGSSAVTQSSDRQNFLLGLGGFFSLTPNIQLRSDLVRFREKRMERLPEKGVIAMFELQLKI